MTANDSAIQRQAAEQQFAVELQALAKEDSRRRWTVAGVLAGLIAGVSVADPANTHGQPLRDGEPATDARVWAKLKAM